MPENPLLGNDRGIIDHLRHRTRHMCVIYQDHVLPPGCEPASARVGIDPAGDGVALLVGNPDRTGIRYTGPDPAVATWISTGRAEFVSVDALVAWYRSVAGHPGPEPAPPSPTGPQQGNGTVRGDVPRRRAGDVTDLASIGTGPDTPKPLTRQGLIEALSAEVAGQRLALEAVAGAVAAHCAKPRPRKPLSLMLMGSTGTGKTLTAQILAQALTGHDGHAWDFHRYDMSEFSERHATARLVGAPAGYIGYSDQNLADLLRANPKCVILFDEIEKAHPEVLKTLMGLMDQGRFTGARDQAAHAPQAILIFTSNIGTDELANLHFRDEQHCDQSGRAALRKAMPPEIVGRLGHVTIYSPLTGADLARVIVESILRSAREYAVDVSYVDPEFVTAILSETKGNTMGVRIIEYLIDRRLGPSLAAHQGFRVEILGGNGTVIRTDDTPGQATTP